MNSSEIKKEMIVQYWHFSGMNRGCSVQELVFVKVISFGRMFATVENDLGIRYRVRLSELEYSREGEKSFRQSVERTQSIRAQLASNRVRKNEKVAPA